MKKLILLCSLALYFSCTNKTTKDDAGQSADTLTTIEFENKNYNFGNIVKGEVVEHSYSFTNTGNIDLVIEEVDPSCGCTTPEWTKDPIKPGEKGKILVKFDTQHQNLGNKTKQVAVYSNTKPSRNLLQFTAQVVEE